MPKSVQDLASNRLYRGDVKDFKEAMEMVVAQCDYEKFLNLHAWPNATQSEAKNLKSIEGSLDKMANAAIKCSAEYKSRIENAAKILFAEFANSSDPDIKLIGQAALSGDYSSLAL